MELVLPHRVEYYVERPVPIQDVIGTLQAQQRIVSDLGHLLEGVVDGIRVDRIELRVRSIEVSSLKEAFFVALLLTYQSDLQTEIPAVIERWTGLSIDERYDTLVTVGVIFLLFYGVDYAYRKFTDQLGSERIRKALDDATAELARMSGKSESEVRKILEKYLKKKGRTRELAKAAIKFFRPSRNQNNEPIAVGNKRIESEIVREVPNQVDLSALDKEDTTMPLYGTRIEIRAKDHDHDGSGWGGIVEVISSERKPVRLYPNVSKDFLWERDTVWADIMVTYRWFPDGPRPIRYHIMNAYDEPPGDLPSRQSGGSAHPPPPGIEGKKRP